MGTGFSHANRPGRLTRASSQEIHKTRQSVPFICAAFQNDRAPLSVRAHILLRLGAFAVSVLVQVAIATADEGREEVFAPVQVQLSDV